MSIIEKVIRKEILSLKRVKDTFNERFQYLRLDKNERLLPFPENLMREFKEKISFEQLSGYSELGPLYKKLAAYLKVEENQILLASGSDLAIKSLYEACIEPGDNIVLHSPCYAMDRIYGQMFGAQLKNVPVTDKWEPDIEKMLKETNKKTKFMIIENPNGFIGTKATIEQIKYCAEYLLKKEILLVVDEAYSYVENSASEVIAVIKDYPNLVVSQTFSKGHGLAGLRMGYLVGEQSIMNYISRVRPMHEVTSLTQLASELILDHPELLLQFQNSIKESKKYLKEQLDKLSIKYKDTHANFVLIYFPDEGRTKNISIKLREKKILIRRPFEEEYLKGWSRVCVGSLEDSERFISALKESI